MAKHSKDKIKKIKSSVDILNIISKDIELTKHGKSYFGACPLCDGSHSLSVSQEKQFAHCFACGETFDVYGYFQKAKKLSFGDALTKVKCFINSNNVLAYKKLKRAEICLQDIIENDYPDYVVDNQSVLIGQNIKTTLKGFLGFIEELLADYLFLTLDKEIHEHILTEYYRIFYTFSKSIENKNDSSLTEKMRNLFLFLIEICDLIKDNNYNLGGIVYLND